jgi:hypothetical protein
LWSSGKFYLCHGRIWWYILAEIGRKVSFRLRWDYFVRICFFFCMVVSPQPWALHSWKLPWSENSWAANTPVWPQFNDPLYERSPLSASRQHYPTVTSVLSIMKQHRAIVMWWPGALPVEYLFVTSVPLPNGPGCICMLCGIWRWNEDLTTGRACYVTCKWG